MQQHIMNAYLNPAVKLQSFRLRQVKPVVALHTTELMINKHLLTVSTSLKMFVSFVEVRRLGVIGHGIIFLASQYFIIASPEME